MGWHPSQVRSCGLADFAAAFDGWQMANVPKGNEPDTSDDAIASLEALTEQERIAAWQRRARKMRD